MRAFSVPGLVIVMVVECVVALESRSDSKSKVSRVCVLADSCRGVILMPWTSSICGLSMRMSCLWRAEGDSAETTNCVLAYLGDILTEKVGCRRLRSAFSARGAPSLDVKNPSVSWKIRSVFWG